MLCSALDPSDASALCGTSLGFRELISLTRGCGGLEPDPHCCPQAIRARACPKVEFQRKILESTMHNPDVFSNMIRTAIPDATLAVQDGHVQATSHIKGLGPRRVGCSVANAEKAPQMMAARVVEAFSNIDWVQNQHVFLVAALSEHAP